MEQEQLFVLVKIRDVQTVAERSANLNKWRMLTTIAAATRNVDCADQGCIGVFKWNLH
jgi:hypothetical protein